MEVQSFIRKWSESSGAERANKDHFLLDLCGVLGVPTPKVATGDPEKDTYTFERDVTLVHEGARTSVGRIDLYKDGCFILEAKQGSEHGSKKIGTARRGTPAWNQAMQDALGQAIGYAQTLDHPPPFIVTTDIGHCFELYSAFDGSGVYRPFPNAQSKRVYFQDLPRHLDTLRAVFTEPLALDPARKATKVTREVAAHLAGLARALEEAGHAPERVAKFLMRCIFTMFAEDVGLLPAHLFSEAIEERWLKGPASFPGGVHSLWRAMNEGGDFGFVGKLLRFNGGLFKEPDPLPLTADHLKLLLEAARCDWSEVEPSIFGTLLERALDPHERHQLGAHYTPRAYVERLVRPTIEEPLREEWDLVRAEVRHLVEAGKEEAARKAVRAFYDKLCHTRVLDPACGTGNFLYVTMDLFKRLESEVVALLSDLEGKQVLTESVGYGVTPQQFLGIEVKPWAKEIAELVLWIGYLQWHFRVRGRSAPEEPVLRDYGNIECRDAVLAYDREELVTDERGRPVTRWDGRTYKVSPVTGEEVPDEAATVPLYRYVNPRRAAWPKADFIVGNPPFVGNKRMRLVLGEEYVEALRAAHEGVPESCDFVMYWWNVSADLVRSGTARRFGLITTNSVTQTFSRRVIAKHLSASQSPLYLRFAIPDHPWVESADGASVRIAMTVADREAGAAKAGVATAEAPLANGEVSVELRFTTGIINSDLTAGADVVSSRALRANDGLCGQGMKLVGDFYATEALSRTPVSPATGYPVIRQLIDARDVLEGKAGSHQVIDFFGLSENQARACHQSAYQRLLVTVKPLRDQNKRTSIRELWWRFAWERPVIRGALAGLRRYFVTLSVSKFRFFVAVDPSALWDGALFAVASEDWGVGGVLSSKAHLAWARAAGGTLEDRPTWTNSTCFLPFPFPELASSEMDRVRDLAAALDEHRKSRQAGNGDVTLTAMYNVLEKLRSGEPLSAKEKVIHEQGLVSVLKQFHDDLDAAVFDAYGWPHDLTDEQILERLVKLNAERAAEERRGLVRWLRPEFQNPEGARKKATQVALIEAGGEAGEVEPAAAAPWPKKLPERIAAVRALLGGGESWTVVEMAKAFKGGKRADVETVLQSLAALGLALSFKAGGVRRWKAAGRLAA